MIEDTTAKRVCSETVRGDLIKHCATEFGNFSCFTVQNANLSKTLSNVS